MISPIGPCSFEQLPTTFREAFAAGAIHQKEGRFIPIENDMVFRYIFAVIMFPLALVPAMMIFYLNYYLIVKPFVIIDFIKKVFSESWGVILVTILLIILIVAITIFMGKAGYGFIKDIAVARKEKKNRAQNLHHYGLFMANDCLVARMLPEDGQENCLYFPRKNVEKVEWSYVRTQSEKPRNVLRTLIYYHANDGKKWHHVLKAGSLEGTDLDVHNQVKRWVDDRNTNNSL